MVSKALPQAQATQKNMITHNQRLLETAHTYGKISQFCL